DPVMVDVGTFDVALETATGAFESDQANAIFTVAAGFLRTTFEQQVKSALSGTLENTVAQALEGVFQDLASALANRTIALDTGVFPKVSLYLDGHLSELDITARDRLRAALLLELKTDATKPAHLSSRGVALADTRAADALFDSPRSQLGVRLEVLNG